MPVEESNEATVGGAVGGAEGVVDENERLARQEVEDERLARKLFEEEERKTREEVRREGRCVCVCVCVCV